ncbi:MAG: 4'-phosphopantetheinyl transferase superfamily protein [Actinophytocola sp.]|nr:4'-phosphopantetheinyl transferase superfamily protein [Actinophytocola sp.]
MSSQRPTTVDCDVWWADPVEPAAEYLALLDPLERGRYDAYRKDIDRRRFLTGRVLTKTVLARRLDATPAEIKLDATCADCGKPHGKPRVVCAAEVSLSISHSGERIGLALTSTVPVGLDVETVNRRGNADLIGYALNDTERAAIAHLPKPRRDEAFYFYWTRKEALMKATGRGLKIPLRSITLTPPGETARLIGATDPALSSLSAALIDLAPGDGYRASLALLTADPVRVTEHWWPAR